MKFPKTQDLKPLLKLTLPLENTFVNQKFGANANGYYKLFGQDGHSGVDYRAATGTTCFATHSGTVVEDGISIDKAIHIKVESQPFDWEGQKCRVVSLYHHLSDERLKLGDWVNQGDAIGATGNTGLYTTGPHLHYALTPFIYHDTTWLSDSYNGYNGKIDPEPLFTGPRPKIETPAYKRYGKTQNWILDFTFRFANTPVGVLMTPFLKQRVEAARYVHRQLLAIGRRPPLLTTEEANAIIYGAWDLWYVLDPTKYHVWAYNTKY